MNTGENKKIKTLKMVRRMIAIHKGLELLQKFCLFLQNMNEKFVKMCILKQGWKGGGLGRDLSKMPIQGELFSRIIKMLRGAGGEGVMGPPIFCHRPCRGVFL